MRILVRAPNWIGDQVLAYPFFHHLRRAYPDAHIAAACVPWVSDLMFRGLIDETHVLPRPLSASFRHRLDAIENAAKALRKSGPWDLGISLPNSLSSAWLLYRAGARRRRGYAVDGRGWLLNEKLPWDGSPSLHRAQAYQDLVTEKSEEARRDAREFWGIPPENDLDPGVPGVLERFDAEIEWELAGRAGSVLNPPDEPYWVLAPGATADSRRWPLERFGALARRVVSETGMKGVIVGGPAEAPIAHQLCHDPTLRLVDRTASCPVPGLWMLFRGARFTVCNESGLAHVAALCGSFTQIVCGAADPKRTRPLGPGRVQVALNPVDCWPCERNTCSNPPSTQLACLKGISPESVWEEIKRGAFAVRS